MQSFPSFQHQFLCFLSSKTIFSFYHSYKKIYKTSERPTVASEMRNESHEVKGERSGSGHWYTEAKRRFSSLIFQKSIYFLLLTFFRKDLDRIDLKKLKEYLGSFSNDVKPRYIKGLQNHLVITSHILGHNFPHTWS
jgi:hypothetical protein